jgi:glutathione S-transferase
MDEKARNALELSIAHWERMATGKFLGNEKPGAADCALCVLYYDNGCDGCPIKEHTGLGLCKETPYNAAYDAWDEGAQDFPTQAHKMKEFLERLRDV